ncbi:hypothetical protein EW146_g5749 [Bondarzewia mesenterica]|uniref:Uncharacterized protein n=1 Tax=Bondarzewia mesenterica TaxID=1095465 RepID=A0A4S4LRK1_9AGAM|nr:hypothetical protein EW146_g5749 [Bondarzewia mesenterica]
MIARIDKFKEVIAINGYEHEKLQPGLIIELIPASWAAIEHTTVQGVTLQGCICLQLEMAQDLEICIVSAAELLDKERMIWHLT